MAFDTAFCSHQAWSVSISSIFCSTILTHLGSVGSFNPNIICIFNKTKVQIQLNKVAVIGGGAAGFFAAINIKMFNPNCEVVLFEKTNKLLTKVLVSGGGRCNVTNACYENAVLVKNYPRGEKELRSVFSRFSTEDIVSWFRNYDIELKTEPDGRMFPVSNNSATIANCFLKEAQQLGIKINLGSELISITKTDSAAYVLEFKNGTIFNADKLLITTGGSAKEESYSFIKKLGHSIVSPIPSLFTFNVPNNPILKLLGISVPQAIVSIRNTKLQLQGPLLITHWGLSGPVILKLSAFGATELHKVNYNFSVEVNWVGEQNKAYFMEQLIQHKKKNHVKNVLNSSIGNLPSRLWEFFVAKSGIPENAKWADLSNEKLNRLFVCLVADVYEAKGKTTFKEEFVTCGGVSLNEVDLKRMESKINQNVFFAGEVLNIDGITGGFNFQNAWSTAWIAAKSITEK
ncbi:MAG: NAD(P)/FAD-dependent oxidoreductase [Bacteroidetes bacterium]|nr:NAD(P)/FAD-dependent oxidoreductase [Bacteroidota bacterium]